MPVEVGTGHVSDGFTALVAVTAVDVLGPSVGEIPTGFDGHGSENGAEGDGDKFHVFCG